MSEPSHPEPRSPEPRIPEATVARLPVYLQVLARAAQTGAVTVSSEQLAQACGTTSAKVRKDLSCLGSHGTRGVGYPVAPLIAELSRVLGMEADRPVVLVGIGNLGRALATYGGFERRGFRIVGLVDDDPAKVGQQVGSHRIEPGERLAAILAAEHAPLAVLAVPDDAAQAAADRLVAAGVTAILSFASIYLDVPATVTVRRVDLSSQLQILSFYGQLRAGLPAVD